MPDPHDGTAKIERDSNSAGLYSVGSEGRALYCGIHQRNPFIVHLYTEITLYGIVDRSGQESVIATLRRARAKRYKPIIVRFFEKEIWYVRINQHGWGEGRGEEILVRKQIIR